MAYASHNTVVVIDPRSIQPLQTLSAHKTNVIKVHSIIYICVMGGGGGASTCRHSMLVIESIVAIILEQGLLTIL